MEWEFFVEIGFEPDVQEHEVVLDRDFWQRLTHHRTPPEVLIQRSFEFLLAREQKELVLKSFNLRGIITFFPEFEPEMKKLLG